MKSFKLIILPGYSPHNKEWCYEVKKNLEPDIEVKVHEWRHWKSGSFNLTFEVEELKKKITREDGKIDIIAKSVGTRVCMELIRILPDKIDRFILCGIPLRGMHEKSIEFFSSSLSKTSPEKVLCFQNKLDPFGSYRVVKKLLNDINPKIKIMEKERSDHNYPYFEDFKNFLVNKEN